jgi:hypothetical protein
MGDLFVAGIELRDAEINEALVGASPAVRRAAGRILADEVESCASVVTFCSAIDVDVVD